jgi:hypothetical protein
MSNENIIATAGQTQEKQLWAAPTISVLDLKAARTTGNFKLKDSSGRS